MSCIGVVVAMASEARTLGAHPRHMGQTQRARRVSVCGMGCAAARRAATALVDGGATALLSWGTAGALDPALPVGSIVVATEVIHRVTGSNRLQRFHTTTQWRASLMETLALRGNVAQGALLTSARALVTAEEKRQMFQYTHALAVDMESAAVAEVASEKGLPFIAIRAIVDTARQTLPEPLTEALDPEMPLSESQIALRLLRAPAHWAQLARLTSQYRGACRALSTCAPIALACTPRSLSERHA